MNQFAAVAEVVVDATAVAVVVVDGGGGVVCCHEKWAFDHVPFVQVASGF